jgi:hypothetical protein
MITPIVATVNAPPSPSKTEYAVLGYSAALRVAAPCVRNQEGSLSMWFLVRRLRRRILLVIALPVARMVIRRLALAADRRNPSTRTARALHQADSGVTAVSRRASRASRKAAR